MNSFNDNIGLGSTSVKRSDFYHKIHTTLEFARINNWTNVFLAEHLEKLFKQENLGADKPASPDKWQHQTILCGCVPSPGITTNTCATPVVRCSAHS